MNLRKAIKKNLLFLDGGMGTMLQKKGLGAGELPEMWNITHAEEVTAIHLAYLQAGANAITTNTFGANALHYDDKTLKEVIDKGIALAKGAVKKKGKGYVLFDIGPCGRLLKPYGELDFEEAVELFSQTVRLVKNRVDGFLIETMNDSYETKAAVLAVKENSKLPLLVTNVYGADGKLMTGATVETMVTLLEGLGVDALGMNCSLGSAQMAALIPEFVKYSRLPVIAQPNAGLPKEEDGKTVYGESAEVFSDNLLACVQAGARIVGGCCGTTPAYIAKVAKKCGEYQKSGRKKKKQDMGRSDEGKTPCDERKFARVCSYSQTLRLGEKPVMIGERINPTGKKKLKAALERGDESYILEEALSQEENGADALDVNTGVPGLDEAEALVRTMEGVQSVTSLPLQLDSSDPVALEKAARRYNGKPLVNSVSGKTSVMKEIFPIVKKYGGVVVGLLLDEKGIPPTAEGRVKIAEKILKTGKKYGLGKEDFLFDPLAMAVSADPNGARVTLQTVSALAERGYFTCLGVSNVSFGLPNRELITSVFLAEALDRGLSAAIVNPSSVEVRKTWKSFLALNGQDKDFSGYISFASSVTSSKEEKEISPLSSEEQTLKGAIEKGMKERARELASRLVKEKSAIGIIDGEIIPALNSVGKGFEEKRVFLPQLLMSAEAAKEAFSVVKGSFSGSAEGEKCTVLLATVKGDIHDIGKNIVKALLENYSFRVVDLGKDVPPEEIVREAKERKAAVVGLSALMTTILPAMAETVSLLNKVCPNVKVVVGGAVLTQEYAEKIGADAYAKDAMATVRYCEEIYGERQGEKE